MSFVMEDLRAQQSISDLLATAQNGPAIHRALRLAALGRGTSAPGTLEQALQSMYERADVVFAGEVLSVDRQPGTVVIRWRVDEAVIGVADGDVYAAREWNGLWADGQPRYLVGEHALVMLHAPSAAGYVSPVSGTDGIVPLRGDTGSTALDLRWIATHVAQNSRGGASSSPLSRLSVSRPLETSRTGPPFAGLPVDPNSSLDGALVLGMLHAWQRAEDPGR